MKLCAIQIPYAHSTADAADSVKFLIDELNSATPECDIILTPEYSNLPAAFPLAEGREFVKTHTPALVEAAVGAAKRCNAIVALSFLCEVSLGVFRNTTRVFDRQGNIAGDFYKQHLPNSEKRGVQPDYEYTKSFAPPAIVEVDGIRLGFLICYDTYFTEYLVHLGYCKPDLVLVSSFQRGERQDILEVMNRSLAFNTNAYILRASVSMGSEAKVGGMSMAVSPEGNILESFGSKVGKLYADIDDIHHKYMRTNSFGGSEIPNDQFVTQGRTPWSYRPAGSMTIPGEKELPYPRVCAHRGWSKALPENTLSAFGAAIALGADEIEMDIRFTADGIPVVSHDPVLERVSDGSGLVENHTLAEMKAMDFGIKHGSQYAGIKIASFEEVLAKFARHVIINLHLKSVDESRIYPEDQMQKILDLLKKYDQLEHVYFMGSADVQECALKMAPQIPRCMANYPDPEHVVENALKFKCSKIQYFNCELKDGVIRRTHELGIKCNLFYCDQADKAKQYFADGIDCILTNDCLHILPLIKEK